MSLHELDSPDQLKSFLSTNSALCVVTFSAKWCGPCRASKPKLEDLAKQFSKVPFGYVYESDIGDFLHTFSITAFPTYVCFVQGKEVQRVQGVNFAGIEDMVTTHSANLSSIPQTGGSTLGGTAGGQVDPAEARRLRLARLSAPAAAAASAPSTDDSKPSAMDTEKESTEKEAAAVAVVVAEPTSTSAEDTPMEDADATPAAAEACIPVPDPCADLDKEAIKNLTESMGFSLLRAQKGLLFGNGATVESAVEWLMDHQDDMDIDEPIPAGANQVAKSYKCNDCGKILSNMANLELHANKTGHSDFEESTQSVTPLTPEEKAAKIVEIKELLKKKRAEREEEEKVDHVEREKSRRFMGKEMAKTREEMEKEQRKRETQARKREKQEYAKERARIRAELEKDKKERATNKGKLKTSLGVDGYNPSAIQYDESAGEPVKQKPKTTHADAGRIDEYIQKVSSYRAGGDGGKCLKILKAYVGNVADNPNEEKFKSINMENKAFKMKVKPFVGAKKLLLAVGFAPKEGDATMLVLKPDSSVTLLQETKEKLVRALEAFG